MSEEGEKSYEEEEEVDSEDIRSDASSVIETPTRRQRRHRGRKAQPRLPKIQPVKSTLSAEFSVPGNDPRCWVAFAIAKSRFKRKLSSNISQASSTTTTTPSFQLANFQLTPNISFHSLLFEPNKTIPGLSEEEKIKLGQALAFRMFNLDASMIMCRLEREAVWELASNALLSQATTNDDAGAIAVGMLQELQACITKGWLETKLFALDTAYSICDCLQRLLPLAQQAISPQINAIIHLLQQRSARAQGDRHEMFTLRLLALCV